MFGRDSDENEYDLFQYAYMRSMFGPSFLQRISPEDFLKAAKSGDEDKVKQYIAANQDSYDMKRYCKKMDVSSMGGNTALHHAAKHGHANIVKLLLQTNIDRNARGSNGNTALHEAVNNSHLDVVQALLADDRVITTPLNEFMETPLQIAISCSNITIAKALFESGAFTNQYGYLLENTQIAIANFSKALENCSQPDRWKNQLCLQASIAMRDLLVLHKERVDFLKDLAYSEVDLSKAAIKQIHTMSAEEFADVKAMTEFVKNSGEFNAEAVAAAFSAPRLG